jgi:hypothetical protein
MKLIGRIFYSASAATIVEFLEVFLIWATKTEITQYVAFFFSLLL